jgi:hypothetical protein
MLKALKGYKTYILVVCALALWLGTIFEFWSMEQIQNLLVLLGILGVGTVRSAIEETK